MSRHAGFAKQCLELDFQYPSEGIHRRWDGGAHSNLLVVEIAFLLISGCGLACA